VEQTKGNRLSIMGEAPRLALVFAPALAAALAASIAWPRSFEFLGRFRGIGFTAGIEIAAIGILFWVSAAWNLVRAYGARVRPFVPIPRFRLFTLGHYSKESL